MALLLGDVVKFYGDSLKFTVMGVGDEFVTLARKTKGKNETTTTVIEWKTGWRHCMASEPTYSSSAAVQKVVYLDIDWIQRDGIKTQAGIYAHDKNTALAGEAELP
jgi:hypothetical protein